MFINRIFGYKSRKALLELLVQVKTITKIESHTLFSFNRPIPQSLQPNYKCCFSIKKRGTLVTGANKFKISWSSGCTTTVRNKSLPLHRTMICIYSIQTGADSNAKPCQCVQETQMHVQGRQKGENHFFHLSMFWYMYNCI